MRLRGHNQAEPVIDPEAIRVLRTTLQQRTSTPSLPTVLLYCTIAVRPVGAAGAVPPVVPVFD